MQIILPHEMLREMDNKARAAGIENWLSHAAMIIELTNPMGMRCYSGVFDFSSKLDKEMVIVPDWVRA